MSLFLIHWHWAMYGKSADEKNVIFDEVELTYSLWRGVKLPLIVMWLLGYKENGESFREAKIRAKGEADKLITSCEKGNTVTLLGPGLMNRLIGKELLQRGWTTPAKMGTSNWDYGVFEFEEDK